MTLVSDPVHVATGVHVHADPSFALGGLIPFVVGSVYYSDVDSTGAFGRGRLSAIDQVIWIADDGKICFQDDDNNPAHFDRPSVPTETWIYCDTGKRLRLSMRKDGSFVVKDGRLFKHFGKLPDRRWRLTKIEDPNGNAIVFERDANGSVTSLLTPERLRVTFAYDKRGLRSSAQLHGVDGSTVEIMRWDYDDESRLTHVEAVYGLTARYGYDSLHRQTSARTSDGFIANHDYDSSNRVVGLRTNGAFDGDRFEYDSDKRTTRFLPGGDPAKAITYCLNEQKLIVAEISALGAVKKKEFGRSGDVLAEVDGEGNRTVFSYDRYGNLASRCDPEGRRMVSAWDQFGNLERVADADGNAWRYHRDDRGNLISSEDPKGFRTDFVNDDNGLAIKIMRHDGLIELRRYDSSRRLVDIVDFRGSKTGFAYDGFGRLTAITDGCGQTTRFEYLDQTGFDFWAPSRMIRADGVVNAVEFDWIKRERTEIDGEGRRVVYRYGKRDMLEQMEDPFGHLIRFHYDGLERLIKVENQRGDVWSFERDVCGRIVKDQNFDSFAVRFEYDKADRNIGVTYEDGAKVEFAYDKSGLMVQEVLREPREAAARYTRFTYNGRGLLTRADNDAASVLFERDEAGYVAAETSNGRRIENTFDCCGNRIERRIDGRTVHTTFDPLGAVKAMTIEGHEPLMFDRDAIGREVHRRSSQGFVLNQSFDAIGQLIRQEAGNGSLGGGAGVREPQVRRTFSWSKAFEPTTIDDMRWGRLDQAFDARGQVVAAASADGTAEHFDYDAAMNIAQSGGGREAAVAWLATAGGRVKAARGPLGERVFVTHDQRGRVVERKVERDGFRTRVWRYGWDGQDRLVECVSPNGEAWRYAYDPFGRRISKTSLQAGAPRRAVVNGGPVSDGAPGTHFLWDGELMIEETPITSDGSLDRDRAVSWYYEPASFKPLARTAPEGGLLYIVNDHLGTPREMLDETGSVRWAATLSVWGTVRQAYTPGEPTMVDCPIRFQGQWADSETGVCFNRFRYYDPTTGSYLSPDPIGIFGGIRTNSYVTSSANKIDPLGLAATYNQPDNLGRPTGASADLGVGDLRPSGTSPPTFDPPGWQGGGAPYFQQRSHLIADSLGGSGSDKGNLVTLTDGSNHPGMSREEAKIRKYLKEHPKCRVHYEVTPHYNGNDLRPSSVTMNAVSSDGTVITNTTVPNGLYQNRK